MASGDIYNFWFSFVTLFIKEIFKKKEITEGGKGAEGYGRLEIIFSQNEAHSDTTKEWKFKKEK